MNLVLDRPVAAPATKRELVIDFMYLDLETCDRCRGTDASLEDALADVGRVLDAAGVEVTVHKMLIDSAAQARALGFVSSPTIRVNGQDIALELRESSCAECGEACGCDGQIDCRVWVWQGREYIVAPAPMIVDAMLREVYADRHRPAEAASAVAVPENVLRFLAGKEQQAAASKSCCSSAKQDTCCDASEKASCCGAATAGSCGCQ